MKTVLLHLDENRNQTLFLYFGFLLSLESLLAGINFNFMVRVELKDILFKFNLDWTPKSKVASLYSIIYQSCKITL